MQSLNDDLVKMGSLTESQLSDTIQAIVKIDKEAAENIVKNDAQINELRAKIDDQISTPDKSGNIQSIKTKSGFVSLIALKPSSPLVEEFTLKPSLLKLYSTSVTIDCSSSTI